MRLLHIGLILILSAIVSGEGTGTSNREDFCPSRRCRLPLVSLGGTEYYFHSSSMVNWYDAYAICKANGLRLLSIETAEENNYIKRGIAGNNPNTVFWMSANDLENEGTYIWRSTGQRVNFTDWGSREEMAASGGNPQNSHCVFIGAWRNEPNELWYNAPCPLKTYFICEKT